MTRCFAIFIGLLLVGCKSPLEQNNALTIKPQVEQFISIYQARVDFDAFLKLYADSAQLEDLVYGHHAQGKSEIAAFYNWNDGNFKVIDDLKTFKVEHLIIDEQQRQAVITGHFNEFIYHEQQMGPWRFVMTLQFNEKGLITHQQDWINYTPKADFMMGKNLNKTIP
ncbi:hypothetical protein CWB72_00060 [Pseudoalteromonas phenolica]|uniref:nuclear transport factor 2 family protein n=1 Tax=Pseudoalteromonas phenolica TaxID=161398 RepID=UPI00110BA438|nr:nuclear transport factor 2 family protein [Pseudoalteromonas phenolica]TMN93911.1 hypothetical protein CWB72_00060 [Pseudoalteromonas phenolica]